MGNTLPKGYLEAQKLSDEELMRELERDIDTAYKNISTAECSNQEYIDVKSWNVQVYVDRNSKTDETHKWLPKEAVSRLFDRFNRPYFATLKADDCWRIRVYFVSCPTCDKKANDEPNTTS